MADFLDAALWDRQDPRTSALILLLTTHFPVKDDVRRVGLKAGILEGDLLLDGTGRTMWTAVLADHAETKLRGLVDAASVDAEAGVAFAADLGPKVLDLGRGQAAEGSWYDNSDGAFQARFLRPAARRGMVDRGGLRLNLPLLGDNPGMCLVVRGPHRSGKSHSWYLINHVAQEQGRFTPTWVRVEEFAKTEVTGADLAGLLASKLRIAPRPGVGFGAPSDRNEQGAATARVSINDLIAGFPRGERRCLVIDGLDRDEATTDAKAFGLRLLQAVVDQEITDTCVVLTGFDLPIPPDLVSFVEEEVLDDLSFTDLRTFFSVVRKHTSTDVGVDHLDRLAEEVLEASDGNGTNGAMTIADRAILATRLARETFSVGAA